MQALTAVSELGLNKVSANERRHYMYNFFPNWLRRYSAVDKKKRTFDTQRETISHRVIPYK